MHVGGHLKSAADKKGACPDGTWAVKHSPPGALLMGESGLRAGLDVLDDHPGQGLGEYPYARLGEVIRRACWQG